MKKNKRPRGRPKKSPGEAKAILLQVRVNAAEKEGFADAARLSGQDLSVWVRERLRQAAARDMEAAGQPVPFLPGVTANAAANKTSRGYE
jgi:hypothetical protein